MQKSKLLYLLKSLTEDEMRWMAKFVRSPFYNSNKHLVLLFDLLRKEYPGFQSKKMDKPTLFQKILPDQPFDIRRMDMMMNRLCLLIEQFIVARQLQKESYLYKKILLTEYGERNLYQQFEKKTKALLKNLDDTPFRDDVYFKERSELNLNLFSHPANKDQNTNYGIFQDGIDHFHEYKQLADIKLLCAVNAFRNATGFTDRPVLKPKTNLQENELLNLYQKLADLQKAPENVGKMKELAKGFIHSIHQLRIADRIAMLKILLNACTRFMNRGLEDFKRIGFNLYKTGLEYDCLVSRNKMSKVTFNNIITYGTLCEELDWTREFIENNQQFLEQQIREDTVKMGWSQWHFHKKEYEQVIVYLNHNFQHQQDIFKAKSLLIRTWMELFLQDFSYFDLLITQLEAFEKYNRRSTSLNPRLTKLYLNFTSYTKRIALAKISNKSTTSLKKEITNTSNTALKAWLLEKVE